MYVSFARANGCMPVFDREQKSVDIPVVLSLLFVSSWGSFERTQANEGEGKTVFRLYKY
jgi:hypothetical protein